MEKMKTITEVKNYLKSREGIIEVFSLGMDNDAFSVDYTLDMQNRYLKEGKYFEEVLADIILEDAGKICIFDNEDDGSYEIDKKKWDEAVDKIEDIQILNQWANEKEDWWTGYATLQYIIFGKIIYG